jgi:tetratricopeptide (TPR) repeat protein
MARSAQRKQSVRVRAANPSAGQSPRLAGRRGIWLAAAGLFVVTLVLYSPALSLQFLHWDDGEYVTQNEVVLRGLTADGIVWAFTTTHFANWLPMTWLSHMLDVQLYGTDPAGHHFTTVLLHAANSALLLLLLHLWCGSFWRPVLAAVFFAVHPLRVESVVWIAERKDVLCGTFFLLALLAYTRYARQPSVGRFLVVMLCHALGLMSKTMIVTLPFLVLLLDVWPLRRWRRPAVEAAAETSFPQRSTGVLLLEKLPLLVLAGIASAWTVHLQHSFGATGLSEYLSFDQRLGNALISVWRYVLMTAWPVGLSAFYVHPGSWPVGAVIAAGLGLAASVAAVLWFARRRPYLAVGWFWFLGMLVPVLGLFVQAGYQAIADRYTYLPGIGLTMVLVWGLADLSAKWPAARQYAGVAVAILFAMLALLTTLRIPDWRTDLDLFASALAVDPNNWRARQQVAMALQDRGDSAGAFEHARRSLELEPRNQEMRVLLSMWLLRAGLPNEAVAELRTLVERSPNLAESRVGLARALSAAGRHAEADAEFSTAARLSPQDASIHALWAAALLDQGRPTEARTRAETALAINPQNALARQIAAVATIRPTTPATGPSTAPSTSPQN